jgi:hypothetical protein
LKDTLFEARQFAQGFQESQRFDVDPRQSRRHPVLERCRVFLLDCVSYKFFLAKARDCSSSFYDDLHRLLVAQFEGASSCSQLPVHWQGAAVGQYGIVVFILDSYRIVRKFENIGDLYCLRTA